MNFSRAICSMGSRDGYQVRFVSPLAEAQMLQILSLLKEPSEKNISPLGGRRKIRILDIHALGSIAVKSYARGGVLGNFVKATYLRLGSIRSLREFHWLAKAKSMGIPAPEPLACVWKGLIFYKCWLIMKDLGHHTTLADLSLEQENLAKQLMPGVRENIFLLVNHKIHHVDLHPGNIVFNESNQPLIIDFDKARYYSGDQPTLIEKYAKRWERSVKKHHLPLFLNQIFEESPIPSTDHEP